MPVSLYTGSPGSGKTYYVVKDVLLKNIRNKRLVISNIKLNAEALTDEEQRYYIYINPLDKKSIDDYRTKCFSSLEKHDDFNSIMYVPPTDVPFFSLALDYKYPFINEKGQAPLYVIDECQKILSKSAKPSKSLIEFYQEHRHFSETDIVLITQGQKYLNETLKELIEETYYLQKAKFKGKNKFHVRKYSGLRDRSTAPQLNKTKTYDQSIFNYYKSQTQSKKEIEREEVSKTSKFVIYLRYFFIIAILLCLVATWYTWKSFTKKKKSPIASDQISLNTDYANNHVSKDIIEHDYSNDDEEHHEIQNVNFKPKIKKHDVVVDYHKVEHAPFFNYEFTLVAYIQSEKSFVISFLIRSKDRSSYLYQNDKELKNAGYTITILNNCLALIDHPREQNSFYAHCETHEQEEKMEDKKI